MKMSFSCFEVYLGEFFFLFLTIDVLLLLWSCWRRNKKLRCLSSIGSSRLTFSSLVSPNMLAWPHLTMLIFELLGLSLSGLYIMRRFYGSLSPLSYLANIHPTGRNSFCILRWPEVNDNWDFNLIGIRWSWMNSTH